MIKKSNTIEFRTSGYRSPVGKGLNPGIAAEIGASIAEHVGASPLFIGYDNRRSSIAIAYAVASGMMERGAYVYLVSDTIPTPVTVNYVVNSENKAGVMITGSHLPASDNGIIYLLGDGTYFKGEIPRVSLGDKTWENYGDAELTDEPVFTYFDRLRKAVSKHDISDPDRIIVIDTAHGPSIHYFREMLGGNNRGIVEINTQMDDRFPGRPSEPLPNHIISTQAIAQHVKADLGIATDMDGDRVVFIDEKQRIIIGDIIGTLFAIHYWEKNPGKFVVAPINTSLVLEWAAEKFGGRTAYTAVGPPSIIAGIKHYNAEYAFEESGKYFFLEWGIWPDAMYSTLKLLDMLKNREQSLGEFVDILPKTSLVKEKFKGSKDHFYNNVEKIKHALENYFKPRKIVTIDGIKLIFEDNSWVLVRPSGTERYIRVFSEAFDQKTAEQRLNEAKHITKEILK